jgi:hypothetical protein
MTGLDGEDATVGDDGSANGEDGAVICHAPRGEYGDGAEKYSRGWGVSVGLRRG